MDGKHGVARDLCDHRRCIATRTARDGFHAEINSEACANCDSADRRWCLDRVARLSITPAALVGGLLWSIAPEVPFIVAGLIGLIGTFVFAATVEERDAR